MSQAQSLEELERKGDFTRRHIGPNAEEVKGMLTSLGIDSLSALIDQTVPKAIRSSTGMALPAALSEAETIARLRELAGKNKVFQSFIGMGYYGVELPGVIQRNVLENPGWYTAYTPYQAEVSQGRLEMLMSYQQTIIDLTGMELANASLLDEATAAAEAMAMSKRVSKSKSKSTAFFVDADIHPQTLAVIQTRAKPMGFEIIVGDAMADLDKHDVFGVLLSYPTSSGDIHDYKKLVEQAHAKKVLVSVTTDLLSLCLLTPPGEWGADIVVGSSQRFGVPMGYGGPHAAFFATSDAYKRQMPGRLIGVSVDAEGNRGYRMALQTREQHIRRDKATSNICTAQVLLAIIAACYAIYHGPKGLKIIAQRVQRMTSIMASGLEASGIKVENKAWFDTLTIKLPGKAAAAHKRARAEKMNLREIDADTLGVSFDETTTREQVLALLEVISEKKPAGIDDLDKKSKAGSPKGLERSSEYLTHPVFNLYHSETEMLRYLRWLQSRDIALDRAMIPLGSCTMKLNATTEMAAVTWPEFSNLHPFIPLDQAAGYQELFRELENWLCAITGYDALSLQPNAGSQGEYAGLLAIHHYHVANGEGHRDICLIPASAHGTNPASAMMAAHKVVVTKCDDQGNVDIEDLRAKAEQYKDRLSALMVTYPSTHGVFEEGIREICQIVHDHGGQVYLDGANLNALVGVSKLAELGADVSHLNLHKTFCIPHGGGGPGMGPIGVRAHLAPYLPGHPVVAGVNPAAKGENGPVSAAPWGSSSILPISWAYIAMTGDKGLTEATHVAILSANYIAHRLAPHYPVLYTGKNDRVAHECIIDIRPLEEKTGISNEDIAKRLIDYGFHAPTMSFPVPGTLMIEPTESESKYEVDRFCDAMIAIRHEIEEVAAGRADKDNNVLTNAPHTHHLLLADQWDRPYSKQQAFYPYAQHVLREDKYWPPVGRVDNVYGDRNLICICPPMEAYADQEV